MKKYLTMCFSVLSRIARCPARVPAWAFCGGSPQLCGMQLRGRVALPQQRLLVPVLSPLPRMQLSLHWHQGHGGKPGEEQRGLEQFQPRVHGIRYGLKWLIWNHESCAGFWVETAFNEVDVLVKCINNLFLLTKHQIWQLYPSSIIILKCHWIQATYYNEKNWLMYVT